QTYANGDLVFDVLDGGEAGGEPVVLLHGFPQGMHAWDDVSAILGARGFRTLAPDQRGYSPGARPVGRRAYRTELLAGDIVALLDAAGLERAHIVGHDWGAIVAWALAAERPDRVASLVTLSVPHPGAFVRSLVSSPQLMKSWYMLAFQLPKVPELVLSGGPHASRRVSAILARTGLSPEHSDRYIDRIVDRSAATAMVNCYRALPFNDPRQLRKPVDVPTLHVWSTGDRFLHRRGPETTQAFCRGPYRLEVIEGGSHWLPEVYPGVVADLIADHVTAHKSGDR
ncbi:MAG: alpha/beta fold hydrolase, partial [Acidimicrobiales bacterium]